GMNRLASELGTPRRRPGDRSLREDDRFLFLQLFTAAVDVFYLSYLGADARDGSRREPSVLVAELLDVAAAMHAEPAKARKDLVVQHSLQPFAPLAFGDKAEPRRFSYRAEWHPAAGRDDSRRMALPTWVAAALPVTPAEDTISVTELQRFLLDPAGSFLQRTLGMRLPEPPEPLEDVEPLLMPGHGLERHRVKQAALDAAINGELDGLDERLRAQAWLPPGVLAAAQLGEVAHDAGVYAALFGQWRAGRPDESSLPISIQVDGVTIQGRLNGIHGDALARIRVGAPNGPSVVRDGLHWLLANATGAEFTLAQFQDAGMGAQLQERNALGTAQAREVLAGLLRLRKQGLARPLPWGPYSGWAMYDAVDEGKGLAAAAGRWRGDRDRGVWGEGQGIAFRLALRGRDPFEDEALREQFIAINATVMHALLNGEVA